MSSYTITTEERTSDGYFDQSTSVYETEDLEEEYKSAVHILEQRSREGTG